MMNFILELNKDANVYHSLIKIDLGKYFLNLSRVLCRLENFSL